MRKSLLMLAGAAAFTVAGLSPDRANAIGLPGAQSVGAAAATADITEPVHCRPGVWHHRYRPHDGCFRRAYRGYYPGYYGGYPYYAGYPYYGGPAFFGPGISIGFGFGPRWGWGGRRWGWW